MNGWQRLFVVFCAPVVTLVVWVNLSSRPPEPFAEYISYPDCKNLIGYVTADQVRQWDALPLGTAQEEETIHCLKTLAKIRSGEAEAEARARWRSSFKSDMHATAIALGLIYLLGWSMGWVWRGFRKPN